ncbi:MAG: HipA domain-containing protein, partial [Robiginitalea sp.]
MYSLISSLMPSGPSASGEDSLANKTGPKQNSVVASSFLTKDVREVEKMFRLAVFNVLAHNRDDHAKNFSFLMDNTG